MAQSVKALGLDIEMDASSDVNRALLKRMVNFQFIYSLCGLGVGLLCVIGGIFLLLHGIASPASSWTAKFFGFESTMSDATPGAMLFVTGFLFVLATKFDIKIGKRE